MALTGEKTVFWICSLLSALRSILNRAMATVTTSGFVSVLETFEFTTLQIINTWLGLFAKVLF